MEEVEKGWLLGPLSNSEVPDWQPVSRRFGLIQKKGKLRLIDDYTESGVNACVTSVEAPVLHTVDVAGATIGHVFQCLQGGKYFSRACGKDIRFEERVQAGWA